MTDAEIVANLPRLKEIKSLADKKQKEYNALGRELIKLADEISILEKVNEVFEGVPLRIHDSGSTKYVVHYGSGRDGTVYLNVLNGTTYGAEIRVSGGNYQWLGNNWADKEEIFTIVKRYCAFGGKFPGTEDEQKIREWANNLS